MKLVIVESPTKARTISTFLGKDYRVESSYGHVRDLPKSTLGVDIEHDFKPHYIIPVKARKNVTQLKKFIKESDEIILATDEDREGEAIAWHLAQALGLGNSKLPKVERIVFHEITEKAIEEALKHPRELNMNLVDAQQARRILDRLVGYKLSPFLWKKVANRLSAGRVQSVAVRLIAEREDEIRSFTSEKYWTIEVVFDPPEAGKSSFEASLSKISTTPFPKPGLKDEREANTIVTNLKESNFTVVNVVTREMRRSPLPPFITSTLQQESSRRLRFSAKQTMFIAQRLYEQGLITYMRTDSTKLSEESLKSVLVWIRKELGEKYLLEKPRVFKTKSRLAQEAHEAIRPTNLTFDPNKLEAREAKLYDLIWRRFIASQLPPAVFKQVTIDIAATDSHDGYTLRASGRTLQFDGFLKVWHQKFEAKELPLLKKGETLTYQSVKATEHETEPPPRYNEASLIKTLEEYNIGRPSTYAPIISVIQDRNYVEKDEQRRFHPTKIGEVVNKILTEHFARIVDVGFTAGMEEDLDDIAQGKKEWQKVVRVFYEPFEENLESKYDEVPKQDFVGEVEETDEVCEKCGKPMAVKTSRFGKFLACTGFPKCRNTKSLLDDSNTFGACPDCVDGKVIRRRTKRGRFFYGCSNYPNCTHASWKNPQQNLTE